MVEVKYQNANKVSEVKVIVKGPSWIVEAVGLYSRLKLKLTTSHLLSIKAGVKSYHTHCYYGLFCVQFR